jgi:phospholipid/cholesterol/gamma-HCH transport system substrate-binding protein
VKENVRNFLVGIAGVGGLGGLIILLLLFGELDPLLRPRYTITIRTADAAGLRSGSVVELNGVPIGVVDQVTIELGVRATSDDGTTYPVVITALINSDVSIPAAALPYAATSLLGGASVLQLEAPGAPRERTFFPKDGTATIQGPIRYRMIEQFTSELDSRMAPINDALAEFRELSDTYTTLGRSLNDLLTPQSEQAIADGAAPNLRSAVEKIYAVLDDAEKALELARDWLGDEQMRADAKASVHKASDLIDNASETLERWTKLAASLETDAADVTGRLVPVADELSLTLAEVRRLTRLASEGDGTIAMLLNNPDLYNSLDDAAVRLEQALREIRLFIEKAKAEGLPVQF